MTKEKNSENVLTTNQHNTMIHNSVQNILVPITISSGGESTLNQALYFQKLFSTRITLLQIIPPSSGLKRWIPQGNNNSTAREAHLDLIQMVKQRFNGIVPDYIRLETRNGNNTSEILRITSKSNIDFILIPDLKNIVNTRESKELNKMVQIISESGCPIFFSNETCTIDSIREILLPIDITKKSKQLVQWTMQLASLFKAQVQIVSVLKVNIDYKKSLAYRKANLIKSWMINSGIRCDFTIYTSEVENLQEAVHRFAKTHQPDLIVAMPQQESLLLTNKAKPIIPDLLNKIRKPVFSIAPPCESIFSDLLISLKGNPGTGYINLKQQDQEIQIL
ncbi:MAG: hypothetical protein ACEPOZ_15345 [Marinifilaceae bacterium]